MDEQQEPTHATEPDERAPKRRMTGRRRDAVQREPSTDDAASAEPGADAEADQRALEDEFWGKK